jgi:hydroxyethylthiazole kinase
VINKNDMQSKLLIHCITNPISINQCANAVLAIGAKPIMAEHPKEVAEITRTADALMLNIGNITDARMEAIPISLKEAEKKNIPVVLDIVGLACSSFRKDFISKLLKVAIPTVIKGNYSEIFTLYNEEYSSLGVDADDSLSKENAEKAAIYLAGRYNTIILATGKEDIITDGRRLVYVNNGTDQLSSVTGTGCMLGALCASYLATDNSLDAVVYACAVLGISGELSETITGNAIFMQRLMDRLSTITKANIQKYIKTEERKID